MIELLILVIAIAVIFNTAAFLFGYYAAIQLVTKQLDIEANPPDEREGMPDMTPNDMALTAEEAEQLGNDDDEA